MPSWGKESQERCESDNLIPITIEVIIFMYKNMCITISEHTWRQKKKSKETGIILKNTIRHVVYSTYTMQRTDSAYTKAYNEN